MWKTSVLTLLASVFIFLFFYFSWLLLHSYLMKRSTRKKKEEHSPFHYMFFRKSLTHNENSLTAILNRKKPIQVHPGVQTRPAWAEYHCPTTCAPQHLQFSLRSIFCHRLADQQDDPGSQHPPQRRRARQDQGFRVRHQPLPQLELQPWRRVLRHREDQKVRCQDRAGDGLQRRLRPLHSRRHSVNL